MIVTAPVSFGELIDKLTILGIKQTRISDAVKLANVSREAELLRQSASTVLTSLPPEQQARISELVGELAVVNSLIWDIEDKIRDCERRKNFGPEFIELARGVYHNNDKRAKFKRDINDLVGSHVVEEKSYTSYA